jgi:Ca2+-binding EF-hand superfamily protein
VYDVDGDGHISKREMASMLSASLVQSPLNLTDAQIDTLIDATFAEADTDGDGQISFEEYKAMVEKHPNIVSAMTIESPLDSMELGGGK